MKFEKFKQLIETYGTDEDRWPNELKSNMLDFAQQPEAQLLINQAQQTDRLIQSWQIQCPGPSDDFMTQLHLRIEPPSSLWSALSLNSAHGLLMGLALVFGLVVGSQVTLDEDNFDSIDTIAFSMDDEF